MVFRQTNSSAGDACVCVLRPGEGVPKGKRLLKALTAGEDADLVKACLNSDSVSELPASEVANVVCW